MNTRLYVAGPMTGLPDFNYPAFRAATLRLLLRGYEVEDPSTNADQGTDYASYIRMGLLQMLGCDGIALLPHWGASRGVLLELTVAQAIGIPVKTVEEWLQAREEVGGVPAQPWGETTPVHP